MNTKTLRAELSAKEENKLLMGRLVQLLTHPKDWTGHHHLAGTNEEVQAGRKGNYTALISEFEIAES
jgi:hypothetical protein